MRKTCPPEIRFHTLYQLEPSTGCWLWTGGINEYGYGRFRGKLTWGAHRVSFAIFRGPIPIGSFVCHKCDVPRCVNPAHLFIGDHQANMADMVQKGRSTKGRPANWKTGEGGNRSLEDCNGNAKLSSADIIYIRTHHSVVGTTALVNRFGVCRSTIKYIVRGDTWAHIPGAHK